MCIRDRRERCRLYLLACCPWMSLLLLLYCPSLFFSSFFCTARRALVYTRGLRLISISLLSTVHQLILCKCFRVTTGVMIAMLWQYSAPPTIVTAVVTKQRSWNWMTPWSIPCKSICFTLMYVYVSASHEKWLVSVSVWFLEGFCFRNSNI